MADEYCRLCNALQDSLESQAPNTCNIALYKSSSFILLPAIGPLVKGHVMLVSRQHFASLRAMPSDCIVEYDKIINLLSNLREIGSNILEAEHGPNEECTGGACVAHTHINLFPGLGEYGNLLTDEYDIIGDCSNLLQIKQVTEPYIYARGSDKKIFLYNSENAPPQAIRRAICSKIGNPDWNWVIAPQKQLISETVTFWKRILADAGLI
ncbi:MAG: hypothetical protein NTX50_31000 [Candidatus Sumerlaeota bacterium]|nr:hypothetical protein [Candidatus Sumerlaeota bacterium]